MLSAMNHRLFTMPSSSMVLLFSTAFSAASAYPWIGPQATSTYNPDNWSPRPTQSSSLPEHELFRRDGLFFPASICGWIGGDYSSIVSCPTSSSCVWDTARSYIGCCPLGAPCTTGVYTGCVDTQSGTQTVVDPAVTTCSGTDMCYLNSFPQGYHQYGCGSANMAATVETTFFDEPATFFLQIATTSLDIPAPSTIAGATPLGVTSPTPSSTAAHSSKSSTGPIIGGVAGGIAFIALIGVLLMLLFRKRREYNQRRPGRNRSLRSGKASSNKSTPEKLQSSNAEFQRISSPNGPPLSPEMRIIHPPTFPPPPESHKLPPAPRYFTENESPARAPWSPTEHIPPRVPSRRESPFDYVPYQPRPKTVILPTAYEPLGVPRTISPMTFTSIQESHREGQLIPLTPGIQAPQMSPTAFVPNDMDNTEPRMMSPVVYQPRRGAQSPSESRHVVSPSPSQQSFQHTGVSRDLITPSPSGSHQPLLYSQNANMNRDLITPSPTFQRPMNLAPVELPCPEPIQSQSPARSKHRKTPSTASSKAPTYSLVPPVQAPPPRETRRKPIASKAAEPANSATTGKTNNSNNPYNHIALQLSGSPSQSIKPKTSQQSLKPKNSQSSLAPRPPHLDLDPQAPAPLSTSGPSRSVSPTEKAELAQKFRIKQSSPKTISPEFEFQQAIAQKGEGEGSTEKIERILGFVGGVKSKETKEKAVNIKNQRHVDSLVLPPRAMSPTSIYEDDFIDEEKRGIERGGGHKVTASVVSANILDVAGGDGMGTLPFTMEFDAYDEALAAEEEDWARRGEGKGVKWRDEVGDDGNLAETRSAPRLDTPSSGPSGGEEERGWWEAEGENRGDSVFLSRGQAWPPEGNWL